MQRQAETGAFAFDAPVGGKITFPANAFVKPDGSSVTGNITVSAKDILKASDMLLANKPNLTSNSEMLDYFGEIMMKASQKNTALRLNPGVAQRPPTVVVPVDTATGAKREAPLWEGDITVSFTNHRFNHENQPG